MDEELLAVAEARLGVPLSDEVAAFESFANRTVGAPRTASPRGAGHLMDWLDTNSETLKGWLERIEIGSARRARVASALGRHKLRVREFLLEPDTSDLQLTVGLLSDIDVMLGSLESQLDRVARTGLQDLRKLMSGLVGKTARDAMDKLSEEDADRRLRLALAKFQTALTAERAQ